MSANARGNPTDANQMEGKKLENPKKELLRRFFSVARWFTSFSARTTHVLDIISHCYDKCMHNVPVSGGKKARGENAYVR